MNCTTHHICDCKLAELESPKVKSGRSIRRRINQLERYLKNPTGLPDNAPAVLMIHIGVLKWVLGESLGEVILDAQI